MSKFKKGTLVQVKEKNVVGVINHITRGKYDFESGKSTSDIYHVNIIDKHKENNVMASIEAKKSDLVKVPTVEETFNNKVTIFSCVKLVTNDDKKRTVLVVGIRTEETENIVETDSIFGKDNGKTIEGTVQFIKKMPLRRFVLGCSICHPDDEFDEETGIELAIKNAKNYPLGELKSHNWTMLQDDQCEMMVQLEANYIGNNIDRYLNRSKNIAKNRLKKKRTI